MRDSHHRAGWFIVRRPDGRLDVVAMIGSAVVTAIMIAVFMYVFFYGRTGPSF